jgi:hypothetical protein
VLLHPEHVRAVVGNHVVLEDGRDIAIAEASLSPYVELPRMIADSDGHGVLNAGAARAPTTPRR